MNGTVEALAVGAAVVHDQLRPDAGSSIAVYGCTTEGLGAVLAASDCGCAPIFVIDDDPGRLLRACEFGATHVIDPRDDDPVEAMRSLRSRGVRHVVLSDRSELPAGCLAPLGTWATLLERETATPDGPLLQQPIAA